MEALFGHRISEGNLVNINWQTGESLAKKESVIHDNGYRRLLLFMWMKLDFGCKGNGSGFMLPAPIRLHGMLVIRSEEEMPSESFRSTKG
jgi:hypothetical protein